MYYTLPEIYKKSKIRLMKPEITQSVSIKDNRKHTSSFNYIFSSGTQQDKLENRNERLEMLVPEFFKNQDSKFTQNSKENTPDKKEYLKKDKINDYKKKVNRKLSKLKSISTLNKLTNVESNKNLHSTRNINENYLYTFPIEDVSSEYINPKVSFKFTAVKNRIDNLKNLELSSQFNIKNVIRYKKEREISNQVKNINYYLNQNIHKNRKLFELFHYDRKNWQQETIKDSYFLTKSLEKINSSRKEYVLEKYHKNLE